MWWFDEAARAGAEHTDAEYVAVYDTKARFDPWEDIDILRGLGLGQGSTVLDFGAGTGVFALAAAKLGAAVTAVDVSPAMVAAMRRRVEAAGIGNVTAVEGGLLSYRHEAGPVDFVYSRNALHHLPDFWKVVALQRIRSMLKPGGILRVRDLIYDFTPAEVNDEISRWLAGGSDDPDVGYTRNDRAEHVRSEFSTFRWIWEPMPEQVGFEIVAQETRQSVYGAYTCRRC